MYIRLQMERSAAAEGEEEIALNMDTRNIRNPDEELALQHNRGNSASKTCFVVYVRKVM